MNNNDDDVYLKYPAKCSEWELYHPYKPSLKAFWKYSLKLNETMMRHIDYNASEMVKREINKFDIDKYYVRNMFRGGFFMKYPVKSVSMIDTIWKAYNFDPWDRVFPYFMEDSESDYYKNCNNKSRYAYCVIYNDSIITSSYYKDSYKQQGYTESLINNKVPRMIITTTSLEGVTIACLDVVKGVNV